MPWARCQRSRALAVRGPKSPSTGTASARWSSGMPAGLRAAIFLTSGRGTVALLLRATEGRSPAGRVLAGRSANCRRASRCRGLAVAAGSSATTCFAAAVAVSALSPPPPSTFAAATPVAGTPANATSATSETSFPGNSGPLAPAARAPQRLLPQINASEIPVQGGVLPVVWCGRLRGELTGSREQPRYPGAHPGTRPRDPKAASVPPLAWTRPKRLGVIRQPSFYQPKLLQAASFLAVGRRAGPR